MIYFISDTHLGLQFKDSSPFERERVLLNFLDKISSTATEIFLVGDIFDFWFEWKHVIPKYYTLTLAKLAQLTSLGITIHFFTGNHDLWIEEYLHEHIGLTLHKEPYITIRHNKKLFITHGDTLYKHKGFSGVLDVAFRSRPAKWIAQRLLHPDFMCRFGRGWSSSNRAKHGNIAHTFLEEEDYWVQSSRKMLSSADYSDVNYFVYGHLHLALVYPLTESASMVVLGEWVDNPTYTTMDDQGNILQHSFKKDEC